MEIKRYEAFVRAKQLLGMGYPLKYIAERVGVHRNTVLSWARLLGQSASAGSFASSRRVSAVLRRIRRLSPYERHALMRSLKEQP